MVCGLEALDSRRVVDPTAPGGSIDRASAREGGAAEPHTALTSRRSARDRQPRAPRAERTAVRYEAGAISPPGAVGGGGVEVSGDSTARR